MKTPDEIKKALACTEARIRNCTHCAYWPDNCVEHVQHDALAYIQQLEGAVEFYSNTNQMLDAQKSKLESDLQKERIQHQYTIDAANVMKDEALKFESRLAQAERERDAALQALHDICSFCKGHCLEISGGYLPDCEHCMIKNYSPENAKEANRGGETTAPDP